MNIRVLLVDNDSSVRQSLGRALRSEGFAVTEVVNGQEAVAILAGEKFDIVLLDLNIPVLNGWEALDQIKERHPLLPVVVITANPNEHRTAAADRSVAAILEKPFAVPALLDLIMKQIAAEPVEHQKPQPGSRKTLSTRTLAVS